MIFSIRFFRLVDGAINVENYETLNFPPKRRWHTTTRTFPMGRTSSAIDYTKLVRAFFSSTWKSWARMVDSHTLLPLRRSVVSRIFMNISKPYQAVCFGLFKHRLTPELLLNFEFLFIFYYSLSIRSLLILFRRTEESRTFKARVRAKSNAAE